MDTVEMRDLLDAAEKALAANPHSTEHVILSLIFVCRELIRREDARENYEAEQNERCGS
jgi:hypothetical protein